LFQLDRLKNKFLD